MRRTRSGLYVEDGLLRSGPPMMGGAGWANVQNQSTKVTVVGTTGTSLAFASNVTAGQVIVAASLFASGTSFTPTFTDTSGNVTSWTVASMVNTGPSQNVAIAWGIATSTGACTPKVTWNSSTSLALELFIGSFDTPGGVVSADGAATSDTQSGGHGLAATIQWPLGGGSGTNDLLINMMGCGASFTSVGGSWARMDGGTNQGDGCAYLLNAAGNSAPSVTQSASDNWTSLVVALQATGAVAFTPRRMPLGA